MGHNGFVIPQLAAHVVLGAGAGALSWTLTEYTMHRWLLHGPLAKKQAGPIQVGSVHQAHHREPTATSLLGRSLGHLAIAGVGAAAAVGLSAAVPVAAARSAGAAWSAGYSTYEITHWNSHHRPAKTAWGERLRERHMRHHYGAPGANLGVTMSFWDKLFGTEAPAKVPAAA